MNQPERVVYRQQGKHGKRSVFAIAILKEWLARASFVRYRVQFQNGISNLSLVIVLWPVGLLASLTDSLLARHPAKVTHWQTPSHLRYIERSKASHQFAWGPSHNCPDSGQDISATFSTTFSSSSSSPRRVRSLLSRSRTTNNNGYIARAENLRALLWWTRQSFSQDTHFTKNTIHEMRLLDRFHRIQQTSSPPLEWNKITIRRNPRPSKK